MKPFQYHIAKDTQDALKNRNFKSQFLGGGTNIIDLMKKHIDEPDRLIFLENAVSSSIKFSSKGVDIGAGVTNSVVSDHPKILKEYPLISQAILTGASPQIRNMATTAGNLLQRTRCPYFYDTVLPCNKRKPGSGCGAINGHQRMAGIIGNSDKCVAVHPSDFCVALAAMDADVIITTKDNLESVIKFTNFHRLPGNSPEKDTTLPENSLIRSVFIPKNAFGKNTAYIKIRERDSYAFALVSAAVALRIKNGKIKEARLASGGVAHKPWRWCKSEEFLKNKKPTVSNFEAAAMIAASETTPLTNNGFKISLLKGALISGLSEASAKKVKE